ncbi:GNAT family N-acetyltransferase [Noviherbaspirillum sedimenti]|uniref:GNAT family N-acetyltransferase n=1 Tax=Noviherbaspirillum sedimenti TaxID=2320865 RepID=A0A3A3GKZ7_9BURK|nr:GNAT family N-acetyltransferase [Noviherbaspirillum sedimenti]RJG02936.1 GNAT family N-acetyltransferase [Noviherbaspirillum sedimenti]
MSDQLAFCLNKASVTEIATHLMRCDADFVPALSSRTDISSYAHKIAGNAARFEAWADGILIGLVAAYCNDSERRVAYITSVSVLKERQGSGIASRLLEQCIEHVKDQGFARVELEVDSQNGGATRLYEKKHFIINRKNGRSTIMQLHTGKDA